MKRKQYNKSEYEGSRRSYLNFLYTSNAIGCPMQWFIGTGVKTNGMNRRSGNATRVYTSLRKERISIGDVGRNSVIRHHVLPRSPARRPFRLRPWLADCGYSTSRRERTFRTFRTFGTFRVFRMFSGPYQNKQKFMHTTYLSAFSDVQHILV